MRRRTLRARRFVQRPPVQLRFCAAHSASSRSLTKPRTAPQGSTRDDRGSSDSSFELVQMVYVCCAVVSIDGNYQRRTDRGLSGGNGDGKNRDHDTDRWLRMRAKAPERYG